METPETPATAQAVAPNERACDTCGKPMEPGQDWCLECGTAAPGRLGRRPGWRAATTIIGAVLLLVGGAVAASYAALNDTAQQQAAAPAPPSATPQVAAAPPVTTPTTAPPPATSTPVPAPAPVTTPPVKPAKTPAPAKIPKVTAPTKTTAATPTPPKPPPVPPKEKPGLQPLTLGADAALVYDPYKRATDQTDPADSYDGDNATTFSVTTAPSAEMGVGLDFDLEGPHQVRAVYVRTTTPGFRVEVYGAPDKLPPDILDTRWNHLASVASVAADPKSNGLEKIVFPAGKFRHVLLWFTTPPPAGPTVSIADVRILD